MSFTGAYLGEVLGDEVDEHQLLEAAEVEGLGQHLEAGDPAALGPRDNLKGMGRAGSGQSII